MVFEERLLPLCKRTASTSVNGAVEAMRQAVREAWAVPGRDFTIEIGVTVSGEARACLPRLIVSMIVM